MYKKQICSACSLFSLVFLAACAATGPEIPEEDRITLEKSNGDFIYTEVVEQAGSSDELYDRALVWVTRNYVSANDVIQMNDKDSHHLIVKGVFEASYLLNKVWLNHTLEIRTREGRYQIRYDNFRYANRPNDNGVPYSVAFDRMISESSIVSSTEDRIGPAVADLKRHMAEPSTGDDW